MPRALLIDDEPLLAQVLADLLRSLGYGVDTALSLGEALNKLRRTRYDLVLTDLRMEEDDAGVRLLAVVEDVQPNARRVLMTGSRPPEAHHAHVVLQKPFEVSELRAALE